MLSVANPSLQVSVQRQMNVVLIIERPPFVGKSCNRCIVFLQKLSSDETISKSLKYNHLPLPKAHWICRMDTLTYRQVHKADIPLEYMILLS
jgi:hypothetical protein